MNESEEIPHGPTRERGEPGGATQVEETEEEWNELHEGMEGEADPSADEGMEDAEAVLSGEPYQATRRTTTARRRKAPRRKPCVKKKRRGLPSWMQRILPLQRKMRAADEVLTIPAEAAVENEQNQLMIERGNQ